MSKEAPTPSENDNDDDEDTETEAFGTPVGSPAGIVVVALDESARDEVEMLEEDSDSGDLPSYLV